ncbi:nitroreductase family deazaflavin-dependent oxidoreductase [Nocardioides terrisoli]|uniref:nitroreductase family deazaflavin-dependent oxidoreductase n=1 Tax=Nocardioides terrisoli TaxID=3388267 RepID=UPI00287BC49D|nr:nitroreductase family deazaflavin-dependent oxidoreductase [Nocardioides marmorisolisilvae]
MKSKPKGLDSKATKVLLKYLSRANVAVFKASNGRLLGSFPFQGKHVPICVLRHTGRRTGQQRETPLIYLADEDRLVLVASQGGRPTDPAWYLNISANPDVEVLTRQGRRSMRARTADADERAALWPRLVEHYPDYAQYQSWCPREIPVVVLDPR